MDYDTIGNLNKLTSSKVKFSLGVYYVITQDKMDLSKDLDEIYLVALNSIWKVTYKRLMNNS
jgi:hypothetical protein